MTIDDLVRDIQSFSPNGQTKPNDIKILLGYDVYGGKKYRIKDSFCSTTKIDIYKYFEQVAFIMSDLSFQSSEIFTLGLLVRSLDKASELLEKLKSIPNSYKTFIEYLYYKKGIVLINRIGKSTQFKKLNNLNITDVLNIGKEMSATAYNQLIKCPSMKMSQCLHCSPKNLASLDRDKFYSIWFKYEDTYLNQIQNSAQTSLKNFYILN